MPKAWIRNRAHCDFFSEPLSVALRLVGRIEAPAYALYRSGVRVTL